MKYYKVSIDVKLCGVDKQRLNVLVFAESKLEVLNKIIIAYTPNEWIKLGEPKQTEFNRYIS